MRTLISYHLAEIARHAGMDSLRAILPGVLRINANPFQTDLCRNDVLGILVKLIGVKRRTN
jgi:hypothetical protein